MNRGILTLEKQEFDTLLTTLDISVFTNTQLYDKLKSALESSEQQIKILLSEDEIESILDQIGPPSSDNQYLNTSIQKILSLKHSFRPNPTL